MPASPTCLGVLRTHPETTRDILHYESEILDVHTKPKEERQLGEEAFLELSSAMISIHQICPAFLVRILIYIPGQKRKHKLTIIMIGRELEAPFYKIACRGVGPYIHKDPVYKLGEMLKDLRIFRSRILNDLFMEIVGDWDMAVEQCGPLLNHDSEEERRGGCIFCQNVLSISRRCKS